MAKNLKAKPLDDISELSVYSISYLGESAGDRAEEGEVIDMRILAASFQDAYAWALSAMGTSDAKLALLSIKLATPIIAIAPQAKARLLATSDI